jgi:hypothetical protein
VAGDDLTAEVTFIVTLMGDFSWLRFEGQDTPIQVYQKLIKADKTTIFRLFSIMKIRGNKFYKFKNELTLGPVVKSIADALGLYVADPRDPKTFTTGTDRKIRAQSVQKAFPTIMMTISQLIELNASKQLSLQPSSQKATALEAAFRWPDSICFFGHLMDATGKVDIANLANFIIAYHHWSEEYIALRRRPGKEGEVDYRSEYSKLLTVSWYGKTLETWSVGTQLSFIRKDRVTDPKPGNFSDNAKKTLSELFGMNLWAQIPRPRGVMGAVTKETYDETYKTLTTMPLKGDTIKGIVSVQA